MSDLPSDSPPQQTDASADSSGTAGRHSDTQRGDVHRIALAPLSRSPLALLSHSNTRCWWGKLNTPSTASAASTIQGSKATLSPPTVDIPAIL